MATLMLLTVLARCGSSRRRCGPMWPVYDDAAGYYDAMRRIPLTAAMRLPSMRVILGCPPMSASVRLNSLNGRWRCDAANSQWPVTTYVMRPRRDYNGRLCCGDATSLGAAA